MVKPYFQDIDIECWVHSGKLGLWEPSVCVFHAAQEDGGAILAALDELESEGVPSRRTLTFKRSWRPGRLSSLRLQLVAESDQLRVMNISCRNGTGSLEMTPNGLQLVRNAVIAWHKGSEDFGVSPESSRLRKKQLGTRDLESGELWFWGPTMQP